MNAGRLIIFSSAYFKLQLILKQKFVRVICKSINTFN